MKEEILPKSAKEECALTLGLVVMHTQRYIITNAVGVASRTAKIQKKGDKNHGNVL